MRRHRRSHPAVGRAWRAETCSSSGPTMFPKRTLRFSEESRPISQILVSLIFLGRGSLAAALSIFGHDKEDVLLLLALIGSQSTDRVFGLTAQSNGDHKFVECRIYWPLAANRAIASKRHTHLPVLPASEAWRPRSIYVFGVLRNAA